LYFGKPASRLTDSEAALMAAVLPNPRRFFVDRPSAYVRERQAWIQGQMRRLRREGWLVALK
jgi:monofunctional biosynthetic peptidoglycan transglycosylase